jgi:Tfp pilus assembly PilM family ATPase
MWLFTAFSALQTGCDGQHLYGDLVRIMAQKHTCSIGLHISGNTITYVQYCPESSMVTAAGIRHVLLLPDAQKNNADYTKAVQTVVSACPNKNAAVVFSLPVTQAQIKIMSMDSDEKNVHNVIELELGLHVTGTLENYMFDYFALEQDSAAGTVQQYLVAAYSANAVKKLISYAGNKNNAAVIVDIDAFAFINTFESAYPELLNKPAVIIAGDTTSTTVVVSQNGRYTDSDYFLYEKNILSKPADYTELLAGCLSRLGIRSSDMAGDVAVCCAGELFTSVEAFAAVGFKFPQAFLMEPFRAVKTAVSVREMVSAQQAPQFAAAMGLALHGPMEL